jgi:hypothetical protein
MHGLVRGVNMDEIAKRKPVNRQAANVVSKGIEYVPAKKVLTYESEAPIPTRKPQKNVEILTGRKFGRLTVIGLALEHLGRWVCRCDCGMYVLRRPKAIKNTDNPDRCERCRHYAYQKRTDEFRRLGYNTTDKWGD